jgi:hypothetical protein
MLDRVSAKPDDVPARLDLAPAILDRGAPARRTKLGDDGNQMPADGNSFPEFILGWTIGANLPLAEIPFPATIAL